MEEQTKKEESKTVDPKEFLHTGNLPPGTTFQLITEKVDDLMNPPVYVPGMKLNIGSGIDYKEGFVNVDKYDNSADVNWELHNLPVHDNKVAQITAFQVIEHLPRSYVVEVLKEFYRVLKNGGNLVITVPDIISACERVAKNPEDTWALAHIYGNQSHEGQFHKWGWTSVTLGAELAFVGFRRIKAMIYDSALGIREIWLEGLK